MSETTTPWAKSVIARYLTVGGSTVEVKHVCEPGDTWQDARATCAGCGDTYSDKGKSHADAGPVEIRRYVEARPKEWAQSHAETCRALPRPDGA